LYNISACLYQYYTLNNYRKKGIGEITEIKEGDLTVFTVDEKKYKMMYKIDTTGKYLFLLIQLKPCK